MTQPLALRLRSGQALKASTTQSSIFPSPLKAALSYDFANKFLAGIGTGLRRSGCGLGLHSVDAFACFLGIGAIGKNLEISLIIRERGSRVAGLLLHLGKLIGRFGVFRLPLECFLISADSGAIIFLFEVPVANLDALGGLVRVPGMKLGQLTVVVAGMFFI